MFKNKLDFEKTLNDLKASKKLFKTYFRQEDLEVELYKPDKVDLQEPHTRDEVYVITAGHGEFQLENELTTVKPGDFLFVAAGKEHRFLNFSENFSTWVLFFGEDKNSV